MTLGDLRREFDDVTIGPLIWGLLVELTAQIAWRYPPAVYNDGEQWTQAGFELVAQEVAFDRFIDDGQLRYIFDVVDDRAGFERLTIRHVRRTLAQRRAKTVVDRLLRRVDTLVAESPFAVTQVGRDRWITLEAAPAEFRTLDDRALCAAANAAVDIPRLPESPASERASMAYTTPHLRELLERVVRLHGGVSRSDLARIFDRLLTWWIPTILDDFEDDRAVSADTADGGLDRRDLAENVRAFVATFDETDRIVLISKSQGIADGDLAVRVGRSRPWVADRKKALLGRIETELLADLDADLHSFAADLMLQAVATQMEEADDGRP